MSPNSESNAKSELVIKGFLNINFEKLLGWKTFMHKQGFSSDLDKMLMCLKSIVILINWTGIVINLLPWMEQFLFFYTDQMTIFEFKLLIN